MTLDEIRRWLKLAGTGVVYHNGVNVLADLAYLLALADRQAAVVEAAVRQGHGVQRDPDIGCLVTEEWGNGCEICDALIRLKASPNA